MTMLRHHNWLALAFCGLVVGAVHANVNLEWRLLSPARCGGHEFSVGLYALSDSDDDQSMAAMDVIIKWDPTYLSLLGLVNDGPYEWLSSSFPNDHSLDGLNDTWADGDALYSAWAQFGDPAYAPPEGFKVTSFTFRALGVHAFATPLEIADHMGLYTQTVVYDGFIPNKDVTGTLETEVIHGTSTGDMNCDGAVDAADIDAFFLGLANPAQYEVIYPDCTIANGDLNADGATDGGDIDPFFHCLETGDCPCSP